MQGPLVRVVGSQYQENRMEQRGNITLVSYPWFNINLYRSNFFCQLGDFLCRAKEKYLQLLKILFLFCS